MDIISQVLSISYFLGMTAAWIKVVRYIFDYRRMHHWRYIVGVLASVSLAAVFLFIIIASHADPLIPRVVATVSIRIAVIAYAVLGLVFELSYGKMWITIKGTIGGE